MKYFSKYIKDRTVYYNKELDLISLNKHFKNNSIYKRTTKDKYDMCFEVTTNCNQYCINCFADSSPCMKNYCELEYDKIKLIIDNYQHELIRVTISGGEPFLHTSFKKICELPYLFNDIHFVLNTNGSIPIDSTHISLLTNNNWLVAFSLHGTEHVHNSYTQSNYYNNIISNIEKLNNNCVIHIYSVINEFMNQSDIDFLFNLVSIYNISYLRFIIPRHFGRYSDYNVEHLEDYIQNKIVDSKCTNIGLKIDASNTYFVDVYGSIRSTN